MSYSHLSLQGRYVITYLILYDLSLREISRRLRFAQQTGSSYAGVTENGVVIN